MLRGILASITGFGLLSALIWLFYYPHEGSSFDFERSGELYSTVVPVLLLTMSFITGSVTRIISRGSFWWTFLSFFAAWMFYLSFGMEGMSDLSEGAFTGYLVFFLAAFLILLLIGFFGWLILRKRQNRKVIYK